LTVTIIGADSLGVRSMCCVVQTPERRIVIDPGVALGPHRYGLPPHPVEVAAMEEIRTAIRVELAAATDVVISHFHGDHAPLAFPDPYQLPLADLAAKLGKCRLWVKGPTGSSRLTALRYQAAARLLADRLVVADGRDDGDISFSAPVAHGNLGGTVLMTRIKEGSTVFVHASDTQLLDNAAVDLVLSWRPEIVFVAGPPLYLGRLKPAQIAQAWHNGLRLAQAVGTLVIDHHLLRSGPGRVWLQRLAAAGRPVGCGAEFLNRPARLLEAHRRELYAQLPVPDDWHDAYARGAATPDPFRHHLTDGRWLS